MAALAAMARNEVHLTGNLVECEVLRYTPSGVPICQGLVEHQSTQHEAGQDRVVRLTLAVRFAGSLAEQAAREALGSQMHIRGFIAPKRMFRDGKSSAALQMHVTAYEISIQSDNDQR